MATDKLYMITILILFIQFAQAKEDWFCTTESSQVTTTSIKACGMGVAKDEDEARGKAFDSAKREYERICTINSTCMNKVTAIPKRTTCDESSKGITCYRMIEFQISQATIKSGPSLKEQPEYLKAHLAYLRWRDHKQFLKEARAMNLPKDYFSESWEPVDW